MGRGWKVLIASLAVLALLLIGNALMVEGETRSAIVTVDGGTLLEVENTKVQVVERGPRRGSPVVLVHCYTCAIPWWKRLIPLLERNHRVIVIDLRGFGGSEKPGSGYSMPAQAALVEAVMESLHTGPATVVGHSMGGTVTTALAEARPTLVDRVVIIDQAPDEGYGGGLPLTAELSFLPVLGPALWQVTPDAAIEDGLGEAFAPGFDVPGEFIDEFRRMTYTSYTESAAEENDYSNAIPLDERLRASGRRLLAIFGSEDQLYDSRKALNSYAAIPGATVAMVAGVGHSPNYEAPARTAALIEAFMQDGLQKSDPVRQRP